MILNNTVFTVNGGLQSNSHSNLVEYKPVLSELKLPHSSNNLNQLEEAKQDQQPEQVLRHKRVWTEKTRTLEAVVPLQNHDLNILSNQKQITSAEENKDNWKAFLVISFNRPWRLKSLECEENLNDPDESISSSLSSAK